MPVYIGELSEPTPSVDPSVKSEVIQTIFNDSTDNIEGIVVATKKEPIGLVMKSHFYVKLGKKFGFDLYMGRPIELIMDTNPLIVDYFQDLAHVSSIAMSRRRENVYDDIVITKNNNYYGTVSVKNMLLKLAEVQVSQAKYTNPLTGLPGNNIIEQELNSILKVKKYCVLYVDLDYFKAYNDIYGFKKGDDLICETAHILCKHTASEDGVFVGHIGGDDFITILNHHNYKAICKKIIEDFDETIKKFYKAEDYNRGYIYAENRKGTYEDIPIVSISIAVISNLYEEYSCASELAEVAARIKKECKKKKKSCFGTNKKTCLTTQE